jgi:hypothetical protein
LAAVVLKASVEMATTEGDDGVGSPDGPEHAGVFEPGADHGLASGLDDTGANKEMLAAEFRIPHTFGILLKVTAVQDGIDR